MRLLIVDDHTLSCQALAVLFRGLPDVLEVVTARSADEAVTSVSQQPPDVVLIDATLPAHGAFHTARHLVGSPSPSRALFLDQRIHYAHVRSAVQVGGLGYWTKRHSFEQVAEGVRTVAAGYPSFCEEAQPYLIHTSTGVQFRPNLVGTAMETLTPRELEILTYLAEGMTVKRCADHLRLSRSTVDNHKTRLMRKLNVHSTVDMLRLAVREGLLSW